MPDPPNEELPNYDMKDEPGLTGPELEDKAEEVGLAEFIVGISEEFDTRVIERHRLGATKYGAGAFLTADTLEMAIEEVLDLANYTRYTFIKLRLLQESLAAQVPAEPVSTGFINAGDATSVKDGQK
jgi:hypothetical protein